MGAFQAGGGCAPPVPASRWSPPAGATALRCSVRGRTAELASRPVAAPLRQAAVSQSTKRAARAARGPALLATAPIAGPGGAQPPPAATIGGTPQKSVAVLSTCRKASDITAHLARGKPRELGRPPRLPWSRRSPPSGFGAANFLNRSAAVFAAGRAPLPATSSGCPVCAPAPWARDEQRRSRGGARSALRRLTHGRLSERSGRRPRSEFGRAPRL